MNKKLTITFLDFDDIKNPLLSAGQARATLEVGKRLAHMGHKVVVIASRYPGYKNRVENGIEYKHIGLGSNSIRLNNLIYILSIPFVVPFLKSDIIVECFTAPISTLLSPVLTKIPVVALPTSFEAERFAKLYHFPTDKIEKFGSRFYKYFLPYTKPQQIKMKSFNKKITSKVVPQGVGNEFLTLKKKKGSYILFLGRYDMGQKGLDLLLPAYKKIANQISLPLVLAGVGPDKGKVKNMIKDLHLEKRVTVMGPVYGKKKFDLLSRAAFVAFPSRHEGFSLFSLEAIAAGLPLVGFDIPGLSWASESIVLKAQPFDISSYARLLKKATRKSLIEKMSKECREVAKKYSWDSVAQEFNSFFYVMLRKENLL